MSYPICSSGGVKNNYLNNPDHHIWNNNGTYWCHYTVHNEDYTKQRVRVSLGTKDVEIARALRDFIMEATPKIAATVPRIRAQAVENISPDFGKRGHIYQPSGTDLFPIGRAAATETAFTFTKESRS